MTHADRGTIVNAGDGDGDGLSGGRIHLVRDSKGLDQGITGSKALDCKRIITDGIVPGTVFIVPENTAISTSQGLTKNLIAIGIL